LFSGGRLARPEGDRLGEETMWMWVSDLQHDSVA
jgi:hypothetical protein